MTYREKYFKLQKLENKYLNNSAIKSLLMDDGGYTDFFELVKNFDKEIKNNERLNSNIERVMSGEPLQYVLGYAYFVNSNYIVTPDVLIPRQETEQLAVSTLSLIIKLFGKDPKITIVDIGTGSGILGIYLKEYFPKSHVICTDISQNALEIAKKNAEKHQVEIEFLEGDILDPLKDIQADVIISNPPYIPTKETVDESTLKYEPSLALFASPKTYFYEEILKAIDEHIVKDEFLIAFEIGEDMTKELTEIIESKYPGLIYKFDQDICGKDRFLYIIKKEGYVNVI